MPLSETQYDIRPSAKLDCYTATDIATTPKMDAGHTRPDARFVKTECL